MGILDQITQMRKEGMSDDEVVGRLQEQGVPPKAINDALNQAEIKRAVSDEYTPPETPATQEQQYAPLIREVNGENYSPQEEYPIQQQYAPQEYYPQQESAGYAEGMDTGTVMEVAEQVFAEKMQKLQKPLKEILDFKTLAESKIDSLAERLKRIESIIDSLQIKILEKVGSYGKNLENTKKEMTMMQDSFSKMVPSLAEKHSRHKTEGKNEQEEEVIPEEHKTKKKISKK